MKALRRQWFQNNVEITEVAISSRTEKLAT